MENCTKFGQLILSKIIKIIATSCQILRLKCTKFDLGWGSAPDPAGGDPLDFKGLLLRRGEGREGKDRVGEDWKRAGEGRGGGKGMEKGRGEGIIVLKDCQLRTLDPPLSSSSISISWVLLRLSQFSVWHGPHAAVQGCP